MRALPGERVEQILETLRAHAEQVRLSLMKQGKVCTVETVVDAQVPPLSADGAGAEVQALVRDALQGLPGNRPLECITVPFCTEGGQFQEAGWPTVVCGPGSIEQAHRPDEFIEQSELAACEHFLDRLVSRQCRESGRRR